jgi:uncharacterized protein
MNKISQPVKEKKFRIFFAVGFLIFGLLMLVSGIRGLLDNKSSLITPNGRIIVEIVDTEELRQKGLSGRRDLGLNEGMLFGFDYSSIDRCFWMNDMNFAIDIVWLNSEKEVVFFKENVLPETYPELFCPDESSQYVLEVKAGRALELGINKDGVKLHF